MNFFRDIVLPAAAQSSGGAAGPVELLVNGGFANGDNWTGEGVISAGKLSWAEGGQEIQTLVGGSVPAGDYVGTIDISVNGGVVQVILKGAADETRGTETFSGTTGTGLPVTITASGEVSKYVINASDLATVDNVTLQAA